MKERAPSLRWGVEQRLEFIEFHLFWEGGVNRADIRNYFGVSVPQASKDLSQYQELAKDNIWYDRSEKRYLASQSFKPLFLRPDASRYLMQLRSIADGLLLREESWLSHVPSFDALPLPRRNVDPDILRSVLNTVRAGKALEVRYQSLSASRPKPTWRWITPHAFGYDGHRWHARAFCHIDLQFKDFLLPRILKTRSAGPAEASPGDDHVWQEFTNVALKPHPGLSEDQQQVIARDYGMKDGQVGVKLRLALLYYFLKGLGLDFAEEKRNPKEQHVVLADPKTVKDALTRAQYRAEPDKPLAVQSR